MCSGGFGIFGGVSLFSGGFVNYVLFRGASAFLCIFFVLRSLLVDKVEFREVSLILVC